MRDVLWGHCEDIGRDPAEISCSSHLAIGPDPDPIDVASRAGAMFDAGIDVVILGFTAVHDRGTVEAVAKALADVS